MILSSINIRNVAMEFLSFQFFPQELANHAQIDKISVDGSFFTRVGLASDEGVKQILTSHYFSTR